MNRKISENASIDDLKKQINVAKFLDKGLRFVGINLFQDISILEKKFNELSSLPDQFNELYSSKGWIAHESLPVDIMKECVLLKGDGEHILINYYESKLDQIINQLSHKPIFKERSHLLKLAKEDYSAGRYHSSIPVVLMLVDGIVNDVRNTGLFATSTNLDVWDSIAGHSTGLKSLVSILKSNRKKTNIDPINLPYRNGILHGRDLNYANKNVAIKTFAILFFIYDWLIALESEERREEEYLDNKKSIKESNIFDVVEKFKEHKNKMKQLDELAKEWVPRKFAKNIENIPIDDNTPESVALKFLEYIENGNYGSPVSFYSESVYGKVGVKDKAGQLKKEYKGVQITDFFLKNIKDVGSGCTEVKVIVNYKLDSLSKISKIKFRMIYEVNGITTNRLIKDGKWKIVNIENIVSQLRLA